MFYRDSKAHVCKQETRILTLHEAQLSVNSRTNDARTKSAVNVSKFSLSKPSRYMHFLKSLNYICLIKKNENCTFLYQSTTCAAPWFVLPPKLSFQFPLRSTQFMLSNIIARPCDVVEFHLLD